MKWLAGLASIAVIIASGLYVFREIQKSDWYAERVWQSWYDEQFMKGMVDACLESAKKGVYTDPPVGFCVGFLEDMPRKP